MDAYYPRADSLFLEKFSLIRVWKFPVPLRRGIRLQAIESARRSDTQITADGRILQNSLLISLLYRVYATTRKSSGEMIRKLSVIRSRKRSHFLGTVRLRKRRIADLNWAKVS
jgi:hypothetical protein